MFLDRGRTCAWLLVELIKRPRITPNNDVGGRDNRPSRQLKRKSVLACY